ncbi:MAG: hypothetical protein HZA15_17465 [Nitrospirae bacterium]|nr:hypothetical protein [Nitrospirota bacterium]
MIHQINALRSWKCVHPAVEVILFGLSEGAAEVASKLDLVYIPEIDTNEFGTPLMSAMFERVQKCGRFDLQAYLNCDIILLDDFLPAVKRVRLKHFLLAGQRWDLDLNETLDFNSDWVGYLRRLIKERGKHHPPAGSDYFLYPRGLWSDLPPFAVGRVGWDNWMIYRCLVDQVSVIDASPVITVVHQEHAAYTHSKRLRPNGPWVGPESDRNTELAGAGGRITLFNANLLLTPDILRPKLSLRYCAESLIILPILNPRYQWLSPLILILRLAVWIVDDRIPLQVILNKIMRYVLNRKKPTGRS